MFPMTPGADNPVDMAALARLEGAFGPEQKEPKRAVNYREGTDGRNCGACNNFLGDEDGCRIVEPPTARSGMCDLFEGSEREATDDDEFDG
jgi:hypothetical protein